jgi:uncharacterized protein YyaL (SSP411 family)
MVLMHSSTPGRTPGTDQRHVNRLIHEKSPYLLQHAHNPVDWYPWGPEAFERARQEDKPVFLSIGYSTCHWCHVMERESFEDPEVARLMNQAFISIKVDREERPDIDSIYMHVCQMVTGSGGWPLTIIMTPDKKPFFAATYIPKEDRFGQVGLLRLIPRIQALWHSRREDLLRAADQIAAGLREVSAGTPGSGLDESTLRTGAAQLAHLFDAEHGGFGHAPKFPTAQNLLFLLRVWKRYGDAHPLSMVEQTLVAMRRGGIYDQLGFGFHRYSTDARWLVPHFEKMLYDQAMLALAYTEAWQATGKAAYARTVREILEYVLRDMTSPEGAFYSAEDADSEGREGKFYLWTEEEIRQVLDPAEAALALAAFGVTPEGNFAEPGVPSPSGENILHAAKTPAELAAEHHLPEREIELRLEAVRQKLFTHRERRVHPHKDDKVLTDWNGLMIAALARAAQVMEEPRYGEAAERAAAFILNRLRLPGGRLLHRYREGEAAIPASLDDYAFFIFGLIELYEATFQPRHLATALELNRVLLEHFWDAQGGGCYFTADDAEELLVRPKEIYDGAVPSGNSIEMLNLLRLARLTGDPALETKAAELARAFSKTVCEAPAAYTQLLVALDFALGPAYEVVIAGDPQSPDTQAMLAALRHAFIPNHVVLLRPSDPAEPEITRLAPYTKDQVAISGKAAAYVCQNFRCQLPTSDVNQMLELLGAHRAAAPVSGAR